LTRQARFKFVPGSRPAGEKSTSLKASLYLAKFGDPGGFLITRQVIVEKYSFMLSGCIELVSLYLQVQGQDNLASGGGIRL
jgi:hypothetical protein